jgi:two-component system LytT family response regulator
MKKLTALIVEDSRLARNEIRELLRPHADIEIIGEAENVDTAYQFISKRFPDLLFLDINMPEKTGFDLLEMLDQVPVTIFTTAYDQYAIRSFEYNALDYLLKPIAPERLAKALEKARGNFSEAPKETGTDQERLRIDSQIFIKDGERCWLVRIGEIRLFEIVGNYTRVYFENENPLLYKSLQQVEEKLPLGTFFRVNRQQIVNLGFVDDVIPWFNGKLKIRLNEGTELELSRRQSVIFKDRMSL